ncbi:MAG: response regulator [Terriglobales bacterium]
MLRILVADDSGDVATWLAILLRHNGYDVRSAAGGAEALRVAGEFHPDVVLLDLGMPGVDGFEVARSIQAQPWGAQAVLIAATGRGEPEDLARTRAAGFAHHLIKPVGPDKLLALLRGLAAAV